jgi:hypothetical protein
VPPGETSTSATIVTLGYRARCTTTRCATWGRPILRYADAAGRPIKHSELCLGHAQAVLERDRAAGLTVYDDREVPLAKWPHS